MLKISILVMLECSRLLLEEQRFSHFMYMLRKVHILVLHKKYKIAQLVYLNYANIY